MQNFAEIAETFLADGAAVQVASGRALEDTLIGLLSAPDTRARLGERARALVEANRGARERSLAAISALLPPAAAEAGNLVPFPAPR
jgi:3-deoxy-D-manno-octulosonic-acid transferase